MVLQDLLIKIFNLKGCDFGVTQFLLPQLGDFFPYTVNCHLWWRQKSNSSSHKAKN